MTSQAVIRFEDEDGAKNAWEKAVSSATDGKVCVMEQQVEGRIIEGQYTRDVVACLNTRTLCLFLYSFLRCLLVALHLSLLCLLLCRLIFLNGASQFIHVVA